MLVFRLHKMLETDINTNDPVQAVKNVEETITAIKSGWPQKADGVAKERLQQAGITIIDAWCEEVETCRNTK